MKTTTLKISDSGAPLGEFAALEGQSRLEEWRVLRKPQTQDAVATLERAATYLRTSDIPVGFPTETVYGLGADATRSASVRGIYAAKGRPSDNPLIVHVADLGMLRDLQGGSALPERYVPLVERFWPGPLTILLPANPILAPEVTAGLATFGARMPSSHLALSLIKLAGVPLAAPSANASTRPSPTTARHVVDDLAGRIELVLDGGGCRVGVESTVVDGLCDPPVVLRPGGVGIDELRGCPGWEGVVVAYRDRSEEGKAPRAPGMKYKHYSPRAAVVLYEAECVEGNGLGARGVDGLGDATRIGVIRTKRWGLGAGFECVAPLRPLSDGRNGARDYDCAHDIYTGELGDADGNSVGTLFDIGLGSDTRGIAQGLFSALRDLDRLGIDTIYVDGIRDDGDVAAAVMNRLRKAASDIRI